MLREILDLGFDHIELGHGIRISLMPGIQKLFESGKVPYLVLKNTLEWHASISYGGRYYPIDILKYINQHYTCETVMKRWDDNALVICRKEAKGTHQNATPGSYGGRVP